jgi:hypothetical protein
MDADSNRASISGPVWTIALLAALGIGPAIFAPHSQTTPRNLTDTAAPPIDSDSENTRSDEAPEHSAAELLEDFFDTNPRQINIEEPWSKDEKPSTDSRKMLAGARANYVVEFLIATLPEPGSPPLRSEFDADLEAITFAANRAGYSLVSFDLPWMGEAKDQAKPSDPTTKRYTASGNSPISDAKAAGEKRSSKEPGLMLFEREQEAGTKDGGGRLLVLLVVGESPTRGVNKAVLRMHWIKLHGCLVGRERNAWRRATSRQ